MPRCAPPTYSQRIFSAGSNCQYPSALKPVVSLPEPTKTEDSHRNGRPLFFLLSGFPTLRATLCPNLVNCLNVGRGQDLPRSE